ARHVEHSPRATWIARHQVFNRRPGDVSGPAEAVDAAEAGQRVPVRPLIKSGLIHDFRLAPANAETLEHPVSLAGPLRDAARAVMDTQLFGLRRQAVPQSPSWQLFVRLAAAEIIPH